MILYSYNLKSILNYSHSLSIIIETEVKQMEKTLLQKESLLNLETSVPTTIFEQEKIKVRIEELFAQNESEMVERFKEVKASITERERDKVRYGKISYDDISELFKIYFYEKISIQAVEMAFSENGENEDRFNIVTNILELLTDENLQSAIQGEPMINAFTGTISHLETSSGHEAALDGSTILYLEKEFLGRNFFSKFSEL